MEAGSERMTVGSVGFDDVSYVWSVCRIFIYGVGVYNSSYWMSNILKVDTNSVMIYFKPET